MIRCSGLQMAELCRLAPELAKAHEETGPYAERGKAIHAAIARRDHGHSPEAKAALDWLDAQGLSNIQHEVKLQLIDAHDGCTVLTEGTADVVAKVGNQEGDLVVVVDWKTGRQEHCAPAADNLQLMAYGAAAADLDDSGAFQGVLVFLDGDTVRADWGQVITDLCPPEDRIKAIVEKPVVAHPGDHCGRCYQRNYCPAFEGRVRMSLALLPPPDTAVPACYTLTDAIAASLAVRIDEIEKVLKVATDLVKNHVRAGGEAVRTDGKRYEPRMQQGRRSASVESLEAAGLTEHIKQGVPYEKWGWYKPTKKLDSA